MPAHKLYDQAKVGEVLQTNYRFLDNLWREQKTFGPQGQQKTLRDFLLSLPDEAALRTALKDQGINIDPPPGVTRPVRIVLFDVESAQVRKFQPDIVANDLFYVLVLPPALRRETAPERKQVYIEAQAWTGAYYHAVSDGYGM